MKDVTRELEHIRKLAEADPERRFNKLYKLVSEPEMLLMAWDKCRQNKGSRTPGVDGETRDDVDAEMLEHLSKALKDGSYRPSPVRRQYIPKRNGKMRPLGIPSIRDRIVQAAAALVLEAIYEPVFHPCSHGFRPKRSAISALRHVAYTYRAGVTWVIEGDIKSCFDALPHAVILDTLRKRVKDERFIALIARFLAAGVMEDGKVNATYSGTPQGGIASPILANIVLHEFDQWICMELEANPAKENQRSYYKRQTKAYLNLTARIKYRRHQLKTGQIPAGKIASQVKAELEELEDKRDHTLPSVPRKAIYYVRYADDFLVLLSGATKEEARTLKERMGQWLQEHLGLTLSEEKTLITHVSEKLRFLGYNVQGISNPNGTRWARLSIPVETQRELVERLKAATRYFQAPELDVFTNVNALMRGWCNYYRFASNAANRMQRLTGVVFWRTASYLSRKHDFSTRKVIRKRYAVDPTSGRKALFTIKPDGSRYFIWNQKPKSISIRCSQGSAEDHRPYISTMWANGNSIEKKAQLVHQANGKCEKCGRSDVPLIGHHPKRLRHAAPGTANSAKSGYEQPGKLLCGTCHKKHHHGDTRRK